MEWKGNVDCKFDWSTLKPTTPFGQLPVLTCVKPGSPSFNVGQTAAIINYVAKVAGKEGEMGEFALSQQLLAEGEDLYQLLGKSVPSLYKKLSSREVSGCG